MVEILPTGKLNPEQALLAVGKEDLDCVEIVYGVKGEKYLRITHSTLSDPELYYMGGILKEYAIGSED